MILRGLTVAFLLFSCVGLTQAQSKVAYIDSAGFLDQKAGITKFLAGVKALNDEFKPDEAALKAVSDKIEQLERELASLRDLASRDPKLVDARTAQAKVDENERLKLDYKRKSEDSKARLERRQREILDPIQQAILRGLQEYAKVKSYTLIFDIAKDQNGFLVAIGEQSADVTKDFITYYNAKP